MTGTILRLALISLQTVCLVSSAHLKLKKRSIDDGPCFTKSGERPTELRPLTESMDDLKERTSGLKQDAESLKDFLKEEHGMILTNGIAEQLDKMNWMNTTYLTVNISKPKEAFKLHYQLLSIYRLYVNQLRTNGILAVKKSEEETTEKLTNFEMELNSTMCSLKIALQYYGSDVNSIVTSNNLNQTFMALGSPLVYAIYRTYITMQDGITLMEFLNSGYHNLE